ncbi:phage tail protein [Acidovorax lacteus]|uniref:Tail fiber protein n=1 Tax=Acidovorax lacteus TaxID=1924988 RepID=A0ABP8KZQ5_9BURK
MAVPFLSEIRMVSFNFAPQGWAMCNGQLLPINQNQALFSLLGTTYGGDGRTNFALPDLRGRMPMHFGNGHVLGERSGSESVTLNISQIPTHTHTVSGTSAPGTVRNPANAVHAGVRGGYASAATASMAETAVSAVGGSQPHNNMPPYLTLGFAIALTGVYPSQN